jgi:molybdate transport system substrate-binding protein
MTTAAKEFRVMTSGAFTAAYKALIPQLEKLTGKTIVTVTTSIGTGDTSIPNRLKRGEVADIVIVADGVLRQFIVDSLVLADGATTIARSMMGFAVRAGAPDPGIRSADDLRRALLAAKAIGYSASESGKYFTTELVQRLGIADEVLPKSRLIGGGERVGTVIARGELDFGFQQISELLPVPGIDHITPLPPELQKVSSFTAGVGANSPDPAGARAAIALLASAAARKAIADSGLEPVVNLQS